MRWLVLGMSLVMACDKSGVTGATSPSARPTREEAAAPVASGGEYAAEYERRLRDDPVSFLTAVAAYHVAPGSALLLGLGEGRWQEVAEGESVRVEASEEQVVVHVGSEPKVVTGSVVLELAGGRWRVAIARQSGDWRVMIHDRDAPLRREFRGLAWFPHEPHWVISATFTPAVQRRAVALLTSRGLSKTLYEAGVIEFSHLGQPAHLVAFGYSPGRVDSEPLLVPFRDKTTGRESYAAGRYLELDAPTTSDITVDFNRATNPLCAYSEHYNCPFPPADNRLGFAVRAGARNPH